LKGLGTAIALPWLESLAPAANAVTASGPPRRLAFFYVPNGVHMDFWRPGAAGKLGTLPEILKPLEPFKDSMNVITGMTLDKARSNGDGPGDHARSMAAFLTGRQPRKTNGADIRVGMSADQHVANAVGDHTRFPSIELGIETGKEAGSCDSGYSCAYQNNLSWRGESTPNAKETNPKAVFERLFAGNEPKELAATRAKRDLYNKSVLDFIRDDAKGLNATLGSGDQRKLEEYFTAIREIEVRIEKVRKMNLERKPVARPTMALPDAAPVDMKDHVRLMGDLLVLAFQTDLTRVATFPFANDGSNRAYKMIDVPDGHHSISHHGRDAVKLEKIKKINHYHVEQLAYIVGKMKSVKEANGQTLLDNSMLVYGSGIGDGDQHNHDDLPILLLGSGGGSIAGGRHLYFNPKDQVPLMNLYLALFDRMGAPADRFGDSTGKLAI